MFSLVEMNLLQDDEDSDNSDRFAINERKNEDDCGDSSAATSDPSNPSRVTQAQQQHGTDGSYPPPLNNTSSIQQIGLKAPAPLYPLDDGEEEDDDFLTKEEYEHTIQRLERINATLRENVAALYAETTASQQQVIVKVKECEKCCGKRAPMELSPDDDYSVSSNLDMFSDMMLTEEHYMHKIEKLQKSMVKLTKKTERQKKLVSQLSVNLTTAAQKIGEVSKEKDEWKEMFEQMVCENATQDVAQKQQPQSETHQAMNEVHQFQIQVIQNELQSIRNLMSQNAADHNSNRKRLMTHYRRDSIGSGGNSQETFAQRLQRILKQLRSGDGGEYECGIALQAAAEYVDGEQTDAMVANGKSEQPLWTEEDEVKIPTDISDNFDDKVTIAPSTTESIDHDTHQPEERSSALTTGEGTPSVVSQSIVDNNGPSCGMESNEENNTSLLNTVVDSDKSSEGIKQEPDIEEDIDNGARENGESYIRDVDGNRNSASKEHVDNVDKRVTDVPSTNEIVDSHTQQSEEGSPASTTGDYTQSVASLASVDNNGRSCDMRSGEDINTTLFNNIVDQDESSEGLKQESNIEEVNDNVARQSGEKEHDNDLAGMEEISTVEVVSRVQLAILDAISNDTGPGDSDEQQDKQQRSDENIAAEESSQTSDYDKEDEYNAGEGKRLSVTEDIGSKCSDSLVEAAVDATIDVSQLEPHAKELEEETWLIAHDIPQKAQVDATISIHAHSTSDKPLASTKYDDQVTDLSHVDRLPWKTNRNSRLASSESIVTATTGITDASQAHIAAAAEDEPLGSSVFSDKLEKKRSQSLGGAAEVSIKSFSMSTLNAWEDFQASRKNITRRDSSGSGDRSHALYANAIAKYYNTPSKKTEDPLSARLSRRQLYQQREAAYAGDVKELFDNIMDSADRLVLVTSKDGNALVPPYTPPDLPRQKQSDGPTFTKGSKDGYYVYKSSTGNEYSGHWKDGKRHGYGVAKVSLRCLLALYY
jgi:hypothetical protein